MKKILFLATVLGYTFSASSQNVGIGTSSPNPSAALDISSNTKRGAVAGYVDRFLWQVHRVIVFKSLYRR
ncbi:MAG: hypothetical protein V4722_03920 [Bacteroidota bacterium]